MRRGALPVALSSIAILLCPQACGYRLTGKNQLLPASVQVIAVPPFENRTRRPEIEQRITEQLTLTFIKRGGYRTTAREEDADAILRGAVTGYNTTPVNIAPDGRATRYEVLITAEVELNLVPGGDVLFRAGQFVFKQQYNVEEEAGTFFDQEIVAIDLIARDFAEAVVTSILEGY